ncbi:MAG: 3-phosphoshikimate 1-carboxyvinyltransferase [Planctomycetota bacterium]
MDSVAIQPASAFDFSIRVPGSKSLTNRALVLSALAKGESVLTGVLFADDTRVMIEGLGELGYTLAVDEDHQTVTVQGDKGGPPAREASVHLGNSGTSIRFLTALCCLGFGVYELDGIPRMRQRPIGELVDALEELGAEIDYLEETGYPPLEIDAEGPGVTGGHLDLGATLSSQYVSALLMAAPYFPRGLDLEFTGDEITSLPYIKMTLNLMKKFGGKWEAHRGYRAIRVSPGRYRAKPYEIEPDASNASYFLAAAAAVPASRCTIEGIGSRSLQGDAEFCDVLGRMGCHVEQHLDATVVASPATGRLRGIDVDLNDMPDMAQTLACLALLADGPTAIRNVGNLRVKETDRMEALRVELTKLGADVLVVGDDLTITPPEGGRITPAAIDTYDDHRMAMAFSVVGLAQDGVTINDPACVNKTFPDFFDRLEQLRASTAAPA